MNQCTPDFNISRSKSLVQCIRKYNFWYFIYICHIFLLNFSENQYCYNAFTLWLLVMLFFQNLLVKGDQLNLCRYENCFKAIASYYFLELIYSTTIFFIKYFYTLTTSLLHYFTTIASYTPACDFTSTSTSSAEVWIVCTMYYKFSVGNSISLIPLNFTLYPYLCLPLLLLSTEIYIPSVFEALIVIFDEKILHR